MKCLERTKGQRKQAKSSAAAGAVGEVSSRFKGYCLLPEPLQLGSGCY